MPTNIKKLAIQFVGDTSGVDKAVNQVNSKLKSAATQFSSSMSASFGWTDAAAAGIVGLGIAATKSFADIQALKMGLTAIAGSTAGMEAQWQSIREMAKLPGIGIESAVQGSIQLQSVGFSARQAEASIKAFGNALATVGRGNEGMPMVVLALTQIATKGKAIGQEIRQLAEQLPQVREMMLKAFGTADSEGIIKLGIDGKEFVDRLTKEFAKLPSVSSSLKNEFENMTDTIKITMSSMGETLAPTVIKILGYINNLMEGFQGLSTPIKGLVTNTALWVAGLLVLPKAIKVVSGAFSTLASDIDKVTTQSKSTLATFSDIWTNKGAPTMQPLSLGDAKKYADPEITARYDRQSAKIKKLQDQLVDYDKYPEAVAKAEEKLGEKLKVTQREMYNSALASKAVSKGYGEARLAALEFGKSAAIALGEFALIGVIIAAVSSLAVSIAEARAGMDNEAESMANVNDELEKYKKHIDDITKGKDYSPVVREQGRSNAMAEIEKAKADLAAKNKIVNDAQAQVDANKAMWGANPSNKIGEGLYASWNYLHGGEDEKALKAAQAAEQTAYDKLQAAKQGLKDLGYTVNGKDTYAGAKAAQAQLADEISAAREVNDYKIKLTKGEWDYKRAQIQSGYQDEIDKLNDLQSKKGEDVTSRKALAWYKANDSLIGINADESKAKADAAKKEAEDAKKIADDIKKAGQESLKQWQSEQYAGVQAKIDALKIGNQSLKAAVAQAGLDLQKQLDELNAISFDTGENVLARKAAAWWAYANAVKSATLESLKSQKEEKDKLLTDSKDKMKALDDEIQKMKEKELSRVGFKSLTSGWQDAMVVGQTQRYADPTQVVGQQLKSTDQSYSFGMAAKSQEYNELKKQNDLQAKVIEKLDKLIKATEAKQAVFS